MDAFFAAVEQRDRPELRGQPIAVGGSSGRGVVASASYEARKYGVRSAMPSITAKRKCPGLIFVKSNFEKYRTVSDQIRAIFLDYTELVQPLSLDEAYLDVTENNYGMRSATLIAEQIRQRIFETTGLTASAGVSYCKFIAKVASDINKPDGIKVITPAEAIPFLEQLPIRKFHGIGKVTAGKMERSGIFTGADLKARSEIELIKRFGKAGRHYYRIVRGIDERPVNPNRIRKSIGAERTYRENLTDVDTMKTHLLPLAEKVFTGMTNKDNFGRTVTLKAKNPDFRIFTRSRSFAHPIRELATLHRIACDLLDTHYPEFPEVRLLGVSVSNLEREGEVEGVQLQFQFE